jgi:DNA-directed RNA polymerase subunit RPC12/RpoP
MTSRQSIATTKVPPRPDVPGSREEYRCTRCGSDQFKPVRSTTMKVGFGLASLLASPNQLECLMCGQKYLRNNH